MENRAIENHVVAELYFLITKFLANGPFRHVGEVLIAEIEKQKILPPRIDWVGDSHEQTYTELERKYAHISPNHLLEICARITTLLDKEITPSVAGITSLLGAGRQSALRTQDNCFRQKSIVDYCTRYHSMPILDSNRKFTHNIVRVLYGRETAGPLTRKLAIPNRFYSKKQLLRRTLGHLSAVYCVLFDRTGRYIITGADDLLVKLWSAIDGRLLFTFRGASAEITDIAINLENTLLAAGSLDHILRVWDLQTATPIAVLCCHTGMITSVNFCPAPREYLKYLVTTSTDGSVAFWQYATNRDGKTQFAAKPTQYLEKLRPGQAQMIYASFSPGGLFLAAGSADHHVRVYQMVDEGPKRILETEAHADTVDSIQWAHNSLRFVSGSKDGTALVWHFETQQWKSMRLDMSERLPSCPAPTEENKKLKVTMVGWDLTDKFVVTAVNDFTIKVWNTETGKLHRVMRGHTDELYVLESHPKDPHILLSAGHDGKLFIWDVLEGEEIASFTNQIDGQGHGGVYDAKWSPDGTMVAATDSHGHILMYGFGSGHRRLKELPAELFFHTDYRPLIRDANHFVMDEQTQTVPHLMPPPFLVDVDGNPYPPPLQKLVPGRENCSNDQLVPNISVGPEGIEVVEGNAVSNIDRLIAALANRQGAGGMADVGTERNGNQVNPQQANGNEQNPNVFGGNVGGAYQLGISPAAAAAAAAANRLNNVNGNVANAAARPIVNRLVLNRRPNGEVEGVRQSVGNWQRSHFKWIRRVFVQPMPHARLQTLRHTVHTAGQQEMEHYRRELRRRPTMISTSSPNSSTIPRAPTHLRGRRIGGRTRSSNTLRAANPTPSVNVNRVSNYRTRAVRDREREQNVEDDDDEDETSASSDSSDGTLAEDQLSSSSSSSDSSSDYSDWVNQDAEQATLEPPKRSKRKRVKPRSYSPSESNGNHGVRNIGEGREIPEIFRPPEWLSEVIPRKAPYYPQMGDEVVYFQQGHKLYLDAVRQKNVYKLAANCEPWQRYDLRDHECVKVIGIKYEIRPPRLCCLKLGLMNNDGSLTNQAFTIKYHDMLGVLDFLVLKQTYDTAVQRLWSQGDRFRCMIEDGWWIGQITERVAYSEEFPDSLFMCFQIRWDSGETERMSPWDMEPIDNSRMPPAVGGVVHVQAEELQSMLYQPTSEEWPRGDRVATCRRIVAGLEEVMGLAIADPFLAPVDLNLYPTYAFVVEYPIDLTTIKSRFENHFYRRVAAAQFDVRYLATNAEKFNQSDSHIVRHARIITDLCLRIIKDQNEIDVNAVYHQLVDTYQSDSDDNQQPGTSTGTVTPAGRTRSRRNAVNSSGGSSGSDWRSKCRQLLDIIWNNPDSEPFREPVDTIEHPDYLQIVDTPMDLRTIKEDLIGGNYESQTQFFKDMRIIFSNSKAYNTNQRSRIYSMTMRLNNLFEDQIKKIFKRSSTKSSRPTRNRNTNGRHAPSSHSLTNGGPSTSRQYTRVRHHSSDEEEEEEIDVETPSTSTGRSTRQIRRARRTNQSNGVSSSHTNEPGTSGYNNKRKRRIYSDDDDDEEEEITEASSDSSDHDSDDSENYNPTEPKSSKKYSPKKNGQTDRKVNGSTSKRSRRLALEEDEEEVDIETVHHTKQNGTRSNGKRGRPRKHPVSDSENEEIEEESENEEEEEQEAEPESDQESEEVESNSKRRRTSRKYDSDQSYRQAPATNRSRRNNRLHQSDEEVVHPTRPTRSATKREYRRWAQEDSDEDHDEDSQPKPSSSQNVTTSTRRSAVTPSAVQQDQRLRTRRRILQDDEEEEEIVPEEVTRPTRLRRQTHRSTHLESSNDDDSEDDQVLSQLARNKTKSNFQKPTTSTEFVDTTSPIRQNGSSLPRTREIIRRRKTSTSTNSTTIITGHSVTRSSTTSESSTQIEIRRNQVQEDHNYGEPGPSTLRHSRRLNQVTRPIPSTPVAEVDPLEIHEHTPLSRLRNRTPRTTHTQDDDLSDPEDDKPLQLMVNESPLRNRPSRHATRYSDEHVGPSNSATSSTRSSRTQKRPHYNEMDSDEDDDLNHRTKRRVTQTPVAGRQTWNSSGSGSARREGTRSQYFDGETSNSGFDDDDDDEGDEEPQISVSSRGRIRKISSKIRRNR